MKNICVTDEEGTRRWFQNGQHHRTDGPAIEWANGTRHWLQNNQYHRTDGPAVEWANGNRYWYQNNQHHRTDGPAIERANGTRRWFLEAVEHSFEEYVNKIYPNDCSKKTLFILKWSSR